MILGTVLESKSQPTGYGREYRVQWDPNPAANSMDGAAGTALSNSTEYRQGDRVILEYQIGFNYGLWYIVGRLLAESASYAPECEQCGEPIGEEYRLCPDCWREVVQRDHRKDDGEEK